ncbi:MAG: hypothetical protein JXB36_13070 [Gammaproteobacteria bacterium]|nr:hypothetical protein [Gammaproteobacteria bacterium]
MPTFPIPPAAAELLATTAWLLFFGGAALVVASWAGRVARRLGWAGAAMTITGAAMSWAGPEGKALLLAGGAVLVAAQLWPRRGKARLWQPRRRGHEPWNQEAALLSLCGGDKAVVERLIRHEIERNPKLSRAGAALAAAARLRHERERSG